jgi:hypothetical protein
MKLNEVIPDNREKILKTKKGSVIKRSKYGVGKLIGGSLYLHRNYLNSLPGEIGKRVLDAESTINGFEYNALKIGKDNVTFISSPDFDSSNEPTVGNYVVVKNDGTTRTGSSKSIWHHKWLWVKDDYSGFDVMDSFERSMKYLKLDIDFSRIGNKKFWDSNYGKYL